MGPPRYRDELEEDGEAPDELDLPSPDPEEGTREDAPDRGNPEPPNRLPPDDDEDVPW